MGNVIVHATMSLDGFIAGLHTAVLGGTCVPPPRFYTKLCVAIGLAPMVSISDNPCRSGELASPV